MSRIVFFIIEFLISKSLRQNSEILSFRTLPSTAGTMAFKFITLSKVMFFLKNLVSFSALKFVLRKWEVIALVMVVIISPLQCLAKHEITLLLELFSAWLSRKNSSKIIGRISFFETENSINCFRGIKNWLFKMKHRIVRYLFNMIYAW